MSLRGNGNGSGMIAALPAGYLSPIADNRGFGASFLYYLDASVSITTQLLSFRQESASEPFFDVRVEKNGAGNDNTRVDIRYQKADDSDVFNNDSSTDVPPMTWNRITVLFYKIGSSYAATVWQNGNAAYTQSGLSEELVHEIFTHLVIGRGFAGSQWTNVNHVCDLSVYTDLTLEDTESLHNQLYDEGNYKKTSQTLAYLFAKSIVPLDRTPITDTLVSNSDEELFDLFGYFSFIQEGGTNDAYWSTIPPPYSSTNPPIVFDDPESLNESMVVGTPAILFAGVTVAHFEDPSDLDLYIFISDTSKVSLSPEAVDNAGLTDEGGGAYSFVGTAADITNILQNLQFDPIDTISATVSATVSDDDDDPVAVTRVLTISDPDPTIPVIDQTLDFGVVEVGETKLIRVALFNYTGAPQSIRIDSIVASGTDIFIHTMPVSMVIPYGIPPTTEQYPFMVVGFSPSAAVERTGTVTITTTDTGDPSYENAANSPYVFTILGEGHQDEAPAAQQCVGLVADIPFEVDAPGESWDGVLSAQNDDNEFAQCSLSVTGNRLSKTLAFPFHTDGNLDASSAVASLAFSLASFFGGSTAQPRIRSVKLRCPASGYLSDDLSQFLPTRDLAETERLDPFNVMDSGVNLTGADLNGSMFLQPNMKPRFEVVFEIPISEASGEAEIYVDYASFGSEACTQASAVGGSLFGGQFARRIFTTNIFKGLIQ